MELRRTDGPMQLEGDDVRRIEVHKVHRIPVTVRDLVDIDNLMVRTHTQ